MASSTAQIHPLGATPFATTNNSTKSLLFGQGLRNSVSFSQKISSFKLSKTRRNRGNGSLRVVAEKVVGIDLGTTNSAVGAMEGGKPVIVTNAEGQRTTPSVVAYTKNGDRLVGQIAKRQAVVNPENTFFSVKRFIGRKMSEVDEESKQVSYTVVRDENGNVKLDCPAIGKQFAAEEISAQVLRKLVDDASKFLNDKVTKAVVTVPAYFNDSQRTATKDAGRIAGLEVLRIINEPTAASLAYGFERKNNETILVFDLGGGTFDVSVLEVGDGVFEVLSTSGDTHLGGDDFDKRVVDWLAASFKKDEGIDLLKDKQALQRLTETAEKAKMELSTLTQANISLPFITATADGPKHIDTTLTRAKFEELCSDLLDRLKAPVENSLRDAKLSFKDLDEVILVGGSTRIPAVQEVIKSLTGKEPNVTVNPDEVVALGAAVQAGVLAGDVSDIVLLDVTPLSIGLETLGGVMTKIIPRNTTLPTSKSEVFSTAADGQTSVEINVLQGEREFVRDNKSLGSFRLDGIPPAPRGVPQIEVKFDIDANGILSVTAIDKGTGKKQDITITGASTLPNDEVQRMVSEAEKFAKEDKEKRDAIDTKNQADSVVYQTEKQLKELGEKVPVAVKEKVEEKLGLLKEAISGGSTQTIKDAMAALNQEVMQLGQSLYNQPGGAGGPAPGDAPGAESSESSSAGGGGKGPEGDVIDADFTDSK
ncbi:stromal 70 kDa heat shock-related protein, chloroplastic-like [Cynara cardunculus var. scolymus]|uniref:stromal 70 kDa heat shock-related protein, chloroplastic-like n=1 Tax=Cynara cardunculus var. scolymus TaxID=59895 RepID=UPI000D623011|nr:stromal 70 kDa heat shock-related protein, chloroplastic-like [Cynara cardunculus var. scolymus]